MLISKLKESVLRKSNSRLEFYYLNHIFCVQHNTGQDECDSKATIANDKHSPFQDQSDEREISDI